MLKNMDEPHSQIYREKQGKTCIFYEWTKFMVILVYFIYRFLLEKVKVCQNSYTINIHRPSYIVPLPTISEIRTTHRCSIRS